MARYQAQLCLQAIASRAKTAYDIHTYIYVHLALYINIYIYTKDIHKSSLYKYIYEVCILYRYQFTLQVHRWVGALRRSKADLWDQKNAIFRSFSYCGGERRGPKPIEQRGPGAKFLYFSGSRRAKERGGEGRVRRCIEPAAPKKKKSNARRTSDSLHCRLYTHEPCTIGRLETTTTPNPTTPSLPTYKPLVTAKNQHSNRTVE